MSSELKPSGDKIEMIAGPFGPAGSPVGVVSVPGFGRRVVALTIGPDGQAKLGRPSKCYHGVGLRPAYVAGAQKAATTDADLCRLCIFERDRLK